MNSRYTTTALNVVSFVMMATAAWLFVFSLLFQKGHDWDIDAFLYIGSRLGCGELLYVSMFETKFPLVQYLFWIAEDLGGIGAWRIVTFLITFSAVLFGSYLFARDLQRETDPRYLGTADVTFFTTSLFMVVIYSLPGSESAHIEMVSASAA